MKILMVNDFKEVVGGTEIYVNAIKDELEKRGHTVRIFNGDTMHKDYPKQKSLGKLVELLFSVKYALKFKEIVRTFRPDIIHVHNIFYELSPSFLLFTGKTPVMMTVHDSQLYSPTSVQFLRTGENCKNEICEGCSNCMGFAKSRIEILKRRFHKLLLKKINVYVGNSEYINTIINKLRIGKTVSVTFGIELFQPSEIKEYYNLTYIGRLVIEKGIQYLIDAMPQIVNKFPQATLSIIGEGEYKETLVAQVEKLGLEKNILFEKSVSRKEVEKYYQKSTIIVIPSIWNEPLCLVGIEAMSVGRPVVASRLGGIPEWLTDGKTGYLVDPANAEQIADKVITILSDRELLKKMEHEAKINAQDFAITKHVTKLEELYTNLIK